MGLVSKVKGGDTDAYANTEASRTYLTTRSPTSCLGYIQHSDKLLYPMWGDLEGAVREGSNRWQAVFGSSSRDAFANYYQVRADLLWLGGFERRPVEFPTLVELLSRH